MLLLLAAALPALFWDGAIDSAPALRDAGITEIVAPAERLDTWKGVSGISAKSGSLEGATKLLPPTVNYRADAATASRAPWLDSNGWRYIRQNPRGKFYYDVPGKTAALAAAEAFMYSGDAIIKTNAEGLKPLGEMLAFLKTIAPEDMPPVADIGFIDDGTPAAGEVINLMVRNNLLFRIVPGPERGLKLTVRLGSKEYPAEDAKNPKLVTNQIRTNLTDEKRTVRMYGSTVVVARLTGSNGRLRLQLLNYTGATRNVDGIRIRVLGKYSKHQFATQGGPGEKLVDYTVESDATEFTIRELKTYAVIDLSR
jgi:hypothetical protein